MPAGSGQNLSRVHRTCPPRAVRTRSGAGAQAVFAPSGMQRAAGTGPLRLTCLGAGAAAPRARSRDWEALRSKPPASRHGQCEATAPPGLRAVGRAEFHPQRARPRTSPRIRRCLLALPAPTAEPRAPPLRSADRFGMGARGLRPAHIRRRADCADGNSSTGVDGIRRTGRPGRPRATLHVPWIADARGSCPSPAGLPPRRRRRCAGSSRCGWGR